MAFEQGDIMEVTLVRPMAMQQCYDHHSKYAHPLIYTMHTSRPVRTIIKCVETSLSQPLMFEQ